jgi:hypothetical protein
MPKVLQRYSVGISIGSLTAAVMARIVRQARGATADAARP